MGKVSLQSASPLVQIKCWPPLAHKSSENPQQLQGIDIFQHTFRKNLENLQALEAKFPKYPKFS